jgi:hypothetical protein
VHLSRTGHTGEWRGNVLNHLQAALFTYAGRAERVCVSGGVNKHHTTVIRTVPTHSPTFIAPAFPAPKAIWAAFHPGITCTKQPLSPPAAPCKTPSQTCAHGKRASLQRGDPLRIPLTHDHYHHSPHSPPYHVTRHILAPTRVRRSQL